MLVVSNESWWEERIPHELITYVLQKFNEAEGPILKEFEVPAHIRDLDCPLYGEEMGDPPVPEDVVVWEKLPDSPIKHRLVNKPMRKTRVFTLEAGPDEHGHSCVLKALYSGPRREKERNDPTIQSEQERASCETFWLKHALSVEYF